MEMRMEMKASLCVGEYCETAYNIEELEIRVYCMEELCYCLKENAFLLDMSIMNDKLVDWIGEECRVRELAKQLYPGLPRGSRAETSDHVSPLSSER